jgi:hypothetical protein
LIGGPNQSHKVNFKEPPQRGKISSKNLCVSSVNTYSGNPEIFLTEELLLAGLDSSHRPVFAGSPRIEGRAEHVPMCSLFKSFLPNKINVSLTHYFAIIYNRSFAGVFSSKSGAKTGAEAPRGDMDLPTRGCVSNILILTAGEPIADWLAAGRRPGVREGGAAAPANLQ